MNSRSGFLWLLCLGGLGPLLMAGCTTLDSAGKTAATTPDPAPVTEAAFEDPEPVAIEEPKSAEELAAEARVLVSRGSSQADLTRAVSLSSEACQLAPQSPPFALQHARQALLLSQTTTDIDRKAAIARQALKSLDSAEITGDDLSPEAAFCRGSLAGLVMQAEGLAAAGKLPAVEKLFKKSTASPEIDQGGPWRALGMLYLKAPAWPAGIGDLDLALENLEKAATTYPGHPFNHICLAQALIEDGSSVEASEALDRAETLISSNRWGALGTAFRQEIAATREDLP